MVFDVRSVRKISGGRTYLLFHKQPYSPVRLPFRYLTLTAQSRYAEGTCEVICRILKYLYTYCYYVAQIDLETQLLNGDALNSDQISGFARWLRLGRQMPQAVIGRIGMIDEEDRTLSHDTFNQYLHFVKEYLVWSVITFLPDNAGMRHVERSLNDVKRKLEAAFRTVHSKTKNPTHTKGLDPEQKSRLLLVADPDSTLNPFRDAATRYRNWLIIKLLFATGMRRSEILCAYTEDAPDFNFENKWKIIKRVGIPEETRNPPPRIKTNEREIALTKVESLMVKTYKDKYRWIWTMDANGKIRKRKPAHPFFLINTQNGQPLSLDSINKMLTKYKSVAFPGEEIDIHPHILRNTFCNEYLEEAINVQGENTELALDNLRRMCGWSQKSDMPALYASKWHKIKADNANMARLKREHREMQKEKKNEKK